MRVLDFLKLHLFDLRNTDTVSFPLSISRFLTRQDRVCTGSETEGPDGLDVIHIKNQDIQGLKHEKQPGEG